MLEVAHILEQYLDEYLKERPLPAHHLCTLKALQHCRTARLGGHVDACDECGHVQISYNSCRNRHCPKCQSQERQRWIRAREQDLLPVSYFHVVFTLPECLNGLCLRYPRVLYELLFSAAWSTLESFAQDQKQLGPKPQWWRCCIPGDKRFPYIPTCTASCPVGGSLRVVDGSRLAVRESFFFPSKP